MNRILKYWCWFCHTVRNMRMIEGTEKGICMVCKTMNWEPKGDID